VLSLQLLCISGIIISQFASRPAAVILSTVFDFDIVFAVTTATFLALVDQLNSTQLCTDQNSCALIGQFGLTAVVSYDFVFCNTWRLSKLQGKVATLIR